MSAPRSRGDEAVSRHVLGEAPRSELDELVGDAHQADELALLDALAGSLEGPAADAEQAQAQERAIVEAALRGSTGTPSADVEPAPRTWITVIAAVAAVAVAVVGIGLLLQGSRSVATPEPTPAAAPHQASLVLAVGQVYVDGRLASVDRLSLGVGARVEAAAGQACIAVEPGRLCLHPGTSVVVESLDAEAPVVRLESGRMVVATAESALTVVVDGVRISGLEFIVAAQDGETLVAAVSGTLQIEHAQGRQTVEPPQARRWADGALQPASTQVQASDRALFRLAGASKGELAWLSIDSQPSDALLVVDSREVGPTPAIVAVAPGTHWVEVRLDGHAQVRQQLAVERGQTSSQLFALSPVEAEPVVELASPKPAVAPKGRNKPATPTATAPPPVESAEGKPKRPARPPAPTSVPQMVSQARAQLLAGNPGEAAQTYERLLRSHPKASEARTATVALGKIYLDKLGRPRAALKAFDRYLAGGPGPLSAEARYGRVVAYRRLGDRDGERSAIADYVRAHPGSARTQRLRERLDALQ